MQSNLGISGGITDSVQAIPPAAYVSVKKVVDVNRDLAYNY
jgi:hypothetical protein